MIVYFDTNVIVDYMSPTRSVDYPDSVSLVNLAKQRKIKAFISDITVINCVFALRKDKKEQIDVRNMILELTKIFEIVEFDKKLIENAANMNFLDYEDYLQLQAAVKCHADYIATRDVKKTFPPNGTLGMKILELKELITILQDQYNITL